MTVSIIIAVKTWQKNLEECVVKCLELDYPDYEIIILPDESFDSVIGYRLSVIGEHRKPNTENRKDIPIQIIATGPVSPAHKRDIALKHAKGAVLAFLDDDAYPVKDWLTHALLRFKDATVGAVGGPAITPLNDSLRQKASGAIYSSILVSGKYIYRYVPKCMRAVDDYPSCNLLVRTALMRELGGFHTKFWPGEDTKLCLDITQKHGLTILYDPLVLVYHHRREVFLPHLKQIANYALHRGYFVKRYPETSFKFAYFIPTLFLFAVVTGALISLWCIPFRLFYFCGAALYLILVFIFSIHKDLRLIPYVFFGIIFTHLTYGLYFIKGLLSTKLKEELIK